MDDLLGLTSPLGFDPTAASMSPQAAAPQYAPQAPQAAPQAAPQGYQPPHGIKAILGMLGDAMLIAHGQQPMYQNRVNQERENAALSGFLTNPDQAIQQLMQVDPKAGISLYSQVHPKSEIPEGVREYSYYNNLPDTEKPAFEKFLTLTHPGMMTPITLGPTDTYEPGGSPAASGPPANAVQYLKAHPELAPQFDNKYGRGSSSKILGGATASPSPTFPVNNPGNLRVPGSTKFQSFATPQEGVHAQEALLHRYMGRGLRNVSSIVETYAPRKSKGGDNTDEQVNNYISYVSRRLNVNPADALSPTLLPQLGQAMREFETGQRVN